MSRRFWFVIDKGKLEYVQDNVAGEKITVTDLEDLLNDLSDKIGEQQSAIEQLQTQLLICQQSKNDDGRFQVWEVPPIPEGKRISFTTNNDGDGV